MQEEKKNTHNLPAGFIAPEFWALSAGKPSAAKLANGFEAPI